MLWNHWGSKDTDPPALQKSRIAVIHTTDRSGLFVAENRDLVFPCWNYLQRQFGLLFLQWETEDWAASADLSQNSSSSWGETNPHHDSGSFPQCYGNAAEARKGTGWPNTPRQAQPSCSQALCKTREDLVKPQEVASKGDSHGREKTSDLF